MGRMRVIVYSEENSDITTGNDKKVL